MAAALATREAQNICRLVDNQSMITLAKNTIFHSQMKHIAICYHFIRERVNAGDIKLEYVHTNAQVANVLMKPLGREKHKHF